MSTFYRINDELLTIEVIRRLRVRNALGGGRTAPEGTDFRKLLEILTNFGIFSHKALRDKLATLIQSGDIILTCSASFRQAGQRHSARSREKGVVGRLHPDAALAAVQYFTDNGTPITTRRDRESGRVLYPGENVSYWSLIFDRIYVVSDGLPKSVIPKLKPVEPY